MNVPNVHEPVLFMRPYCREVLWGGTALRDSFGYEIPSAHTGEAWIVSAVGEALLAPDDTRAPFPYPGESCVLGSSFDGMPLSVLYRERRDLFGGLPSDTFPLLVKMIDAHDDLSVQVHPDDAYAQRTEGVPYGKNECWYILDHTPGASIIAGHSAKDRETLTRMIREGDWAHLLKKQEIHTEDFFYIPAGTVHALLRGTLLLEIQQTSNLTYRLYDYDRMQNGKKRDLHIEKALDVITCPQEVAPLPSGTGALPSGRDSCRILLSNRLFRIEEWTMPDLHGGFPFLIRSPRFEIFVITEGQGHVHYGARMQHSSDIKKGDVFIATAYCDMLRFFGAMKCVTAAIPF
ncbi:MAG: mannose-6-phosphate isomerase [Lachnospiraceae bacterium]|nr:mannose-6-phosphate isomerase [Lachnospiraceae bacterium]